jgi:tellurite resistance protein TerC
MPVSRDHESGRFFVKQNNVRHATVLFLALLAVESADLMFAIDSIPAVLAISTDPFIVYTSNIFAILGLRSLYFLLIGVLGYLHYLKLGLACVLFFVGAKMVFSEVYKMPAVLSLGVIATILGVAIAASVLRERRIWRRRGSAKVDSEDARSRRI